MTLFTWIHVNGWMFFISDKRLDNDQVISSFIQWFSTESVEPNIKLIGIKDVCVGNLQRSWDGNQVFSFFATHIPMTMMITKHHVLKLTSRSKSLSLSSWLRWYCPPALSCSTILGHRCFLPLGCPKMPRLNIISKYGLVWQKVPKNAIYVFYTWTAIGSP